MPPAVAYAAMAVGAGLQAKGAHDQAKSEEAVNKYNAAVSAQAAAATEQAGAEEQARIRDTMRRTLARNRTLVGASGLQMTGSPFDAQVNAIEDYSHDIATVGYNTEIEASRHRSQAEAFRLQAKAARQAGKLGVAAALTGGISNITMFKLQRDLIE